LSVMNEQARHRMGVTARERASKRIAHRPTQRGAAWTPSSTTTSARPSKASSTDTKQIASGYARRARTCASARRGAATGDDGLHRSQQFALLGRMDWPAASKAKGQMRYRSVCAPAATDGRTDGGGGRRPSLIGREWWMAGAKEEAEHLGWCDVVISRMCHSSRTNSRFRSCRKQASGTKRCVCYATPRERAPGHRVGRDLVSKNVKSAGKNSSEGRMPTTEDRTLWGMSGW